MTTALIDVQCLQGLDPERGIPRWTNNFTRALKLRGQQCVGLFNPELPPVHDVFVDAFHELTPNSRTSLRNFANHDEVVYICPSPFEPIRPIRSLFPLHVVQSKIPVLTVMHDLVLYLFPDLYQLSTGDEQTYRARRSVFATSDLFLTVSRSTQNDLMRLWDIQLERTCVIGAGVDPFFTPSDTTPMSLRNIGVTKDFVFCVGRADARKQTVFAIEMFAALPVRTRETMQLVISCRVDDNQKLLWFELGAHLGLSENQLIITGLVTDDLLRTLYSKCSVFVEPSLYEGFGFPIAEAASCGTVVISSNTSSMIEILEWSESTFDPKDLVAASLLLDRAINDDSYRVRNLEAGSKVRDRHSWNNVATRTISAIDKLARRIQVPELRLKEIDPREFPSKAIGRTFPITDFDH